MIFIACAFMDFACFSWRHDWTAVDVSVNKPFEDKMKK